LIEARRLSDTQRGFVTSKEPFPAFVGGFGSGKTAAAMARAMALKVMCRDANVAYYLPTYPLIRDIAFERFPELLERRGWAFKLNVQDAEIIFPGAGKIIFRNMEQPQRIVGYEVAHSLVDEIDTLTAAKARDAWNKIIARNRQKCGMRNTVGVATTPEGFKFVYERWQKNPAPGYVMFRAKTEDNAANLPENYIDDLRNSYPSNLLAAYLDGEFVNLTAGSVYPDYDRELNGCTSTIAISEPLHIGMDFNVGKMSAVVFVLRDGLPHATDELTGLLDTPAMIAAIKSRYEGHAIFVYPDASGQGRKSNDASVSDLSLLRAARFTVLAPSSNPFVKDRVLAVNQMIHSEGDRRLRVNVDQCPALIEGLEKQAYDKNGEPDKKSGLDHVCFAGSTMVETLDGVLRFDELPPTGFVRGPAGHFIPYHSARKTGKKRVVRLDFASGYSIVCTPDHRFLLEDGSWAQAKDLKGRVCVSSVAGGKSSTASDIIYPAPTLPIHLSLSVGFIGQFGELITGIFPQAATFITSTATGLITRLRIWLASLGAHIFASTGLSVLLKSEGWVGNISTAQRLGINRRPGEHGIGNTTPKHLMRSTLGSKPYARVAVSISKHPSNSRTKKSAIVPHLARPMHEGRAALTTLLANASIVDATFKQTDILYASAVSFVTLLGEEDVYCLTAPETGCFKLTKSSPIVANCDAAGYFLHYKFPVRGRAALKLSLGGF
jgi:hypothetical protein